MRDQRIDFIKGMLMLCVIYGHTINSLLCGIQHSPIWLHIFARTFDMPFFMVLSGYFLKKSLLKRNAWRVAVNRISMIFVPIVIWTMLCGHINVFIGMYYFLWAILAAGMICIVGFYLKCWLPNIIGQMGEIMLYVFIVIVLHLVKVPWNLFYLFPFFVVGYYVPDVNFRLSRLWLASNVLLFVVCLCFWSGRFSPWCIGALAWREDLTALWIYVYRFVLGLIGVLVMMRLFNLLRNLLSSEPYVVKIVTEAGQETLAIYILQLIFVENIIRRSCSFLYSKYPIIMFPSGVNLVGYVVAPILSLFCMVLFLRIVQKMKSNWPFKYMFGFKIVK